MELLTKCIVCNSENIVPYAMRYLPGAPHISRVKCKNCTIIFANPVASDSELTSFYQNYYDKGNFAIFKYKELHRRNFARYAALQKAQLCEEFRYVLQYKPNGTFLDIGFGLGDPLYLADQLGFQAYGTEYDDDAISFVKEYVPEGHFHKGDIFDAPWKGETFDFIRFWHVIEHVKDPRAYMAKIFYLLKPGGVLMIGTPNIACFAYKLLRTLSFLSFRIPAIVDGMEHTVLFSKATLQKLAVESGFEVMKHFSHGNRESYSALVKEKIPVKKKAVKALQSALDVSQTIYLSKPEAVLVSPQR